MLSFLQAREYRWYSGDALCGPASPSAVGFRYSKTTSWRKPKHSEWGWSRDSLQKITPDASQHANASTPLPTQCNSFNRQRIAHIFCPIQLPPRGLRELNPLTQQPAGGSAREAAWMCAANSGRGGKTGGKGGLPFLGAARWVPSTLDFHH